MGFARSELDTGASKTIAFEVPVSVLAYIGLLPWMTITGIVKASWSQNRRGIAELFCVSVSGPTYF